MQTVIFDMDGVIFDTERRMMRLWQDEADRRGFGDISDLYRQAIGTTEDYCRDLFRTKYPEMPPYEEFRARPQKEFQILRETEGMPVKPGIRELLTYLKSHGWRIGLASSTILQTVKKELAMAGLDTYFDAVIGGDLLKHSKPEPDIYLMACDVLGVRPQDAYAVEDSYHGIRSASRAGMMPIMIPDLLPPNEEMRSLSVLILQDLAEALRFFMSLSDTQAKKP